MHGDFVWIDLSANELGKAKNFYSNVFGWNSDNSGDEYSTYLSQDNKPVSAIYEMPSFFKEKEMPSFWMTYIEVDDIYEIAELAFELGAKVEMQQNTEYGNVALIRDPLGAGFTCYQGGENKSARSLIKDSRWVKSELFVSSIEAVKEFYEKLFHWQITADSQMEDRYIIADSKGKNISAIQVLENSIKSEMEYWAVFFGTLDLNKSKKKITRAGGECSYEYIGSDERKHCLVYDSQGSFFFLTGLIDNTLFETVNAPASPSFTESSSVTTEKIEAARTLPSLAKAGAEVTPNSEIKWKSILGLIGLGLAILLNSTLVWCILVLAWIIPDLFSGKTYFFDYLTRKKTPILYWSVMLVWIAFTISSITSSFTNGVDFMSALNPQK